MEKETILEIEFKELWNNKFAWKIIKQDEKILKRRNFIDAKIRVNSLNSPFFDSSKSMLYIRGYDFNRDNEINICTSFEKKIIEEKVKAINEKYGIKKRWRAKNGYCYYFINNLFSVKKLNDYDYDSDKYHYKIGNYFKTEEEAKEYAEHMKKCSLEWHEKRENNE